MKSKHIFNSLSYVEMDIVFNKFPELRNMPKRHYGYYWMEVPKTMRNDIGRFVRHCFKHKIDELKHWYN